MSLFAPTKGTPSRADCGFSVPSQPHMTSNLPYSTRVNFVSRFVFGKNRIWADTCLSDKPLTAVVGVVSSTGLLVQHNIAVVPATVGN